MTQHAGDRAAMFPAIEKRYGKPAAFWLNELSGLGDVKYAEQIAFLRERHGFSQAHANALVMYARGSTSSRRYVDPDAFLRELGGQREVTARAILDAIHKQFPRLELVIAWNQPMFRLGSQYVFAVSAATHHLLLAPFSVDVVAEFRARCADLKVNKNTIQVPADWNVDTTLLHGLVEARLAELSDR